MAYPPASFPSSIWDGDTINPDRDGRKNEAEVNAQDWDRIVSEVIATQTQSRRHEVEHRQVLLFTQQWEKNQKSGLNQLGGGLTALSTGDTLSTGTDIVVTKNNSKLCFVVNSAGDATGNITITGTRYSPLTGQKTADYVETLALDGVSQDNSVTTTNGTTKYAIEDAYISENYFVGSVTISTTEVNLTDVDVYSIWYYENPTIDRFDIDGVNFSATPNNVTGAADTILYAVTGCEGCQKITITPVSHIEVLAADVVDADGILVYTRVGFPKGAAGTSTPTNSGLFTNTAFYPAAQTYWESVSLDIWVSLYYPQTAPTPT